MDDSIKEIERRKQELLGKKALFEIDLKGKVDPRLLKPYNDYISLKIDKETYLKESSKALKEVYQSKNYVPQDEDSSLEEKEIALSEDEAKKLFNKQQ